MSPADARYLLRAKGRTTHRRGETDRDAVVRLWSLADEPRTGAAVAVLGRDEAAAVFLDGWRDRTTHKRPRVPTRPYTLRLTAAEMGELVEGARLAGQDRSAFAREAIREAVARARELLVPTERGEPMAVEWERDETHEHPAWRTILGAAGDDWPVYAVRVEQRKVGRSSTWKWVLEFDPGQGDWRDMSPRDADWLEGEEPSGLRLTRKYAEADGLAAARRIQAKQRADRDASNGDSR